MGRPNRIRVIGIDGTDIMHPVTATRAMRMILSGLAVWIEPIEGATGEKACRKLQVVADQSSNSSASLIEAGSLFRRRIEREVDPGCSLSEAVKYVAQRSPYRWGSNGR